MIGHDATANTCSCTDDSRDQPKPAYVRTTTSDTATPQITHPRSPSPPPQYRRKHDSETLEALLNHSGALNVDRDYQRSTSGVYEDDDSACTAPTVSAHATRPRSVRNPIPGPIVSVKCEFQTLTRLSRGQEISCLVTIEVPKGKWKPRHSDILYLPTRLVDTRSVQSDESEDVDEAMDEKALRLKDAAEQLYIRVPNWDTLDFRK
jgi:hypothetical protein